MQPELISNDGGGRMAAAATSAADDAATADLAADDVQGAADRLRAADVVGCSSWAEDIATTFDRLMRICMFLCKLCMDNIWFQLMQFHLAK